MGQDARDIQVTETHGFTQRLTKLASVLHLAQVILGSGSTGKKCFYVTVGNWTREMEIRHENGKNANR